MSNTFFLHDEKKLKQPIYSVLYAKHVICATHIRTFFSCIKSIYFTYALGSFYTRPVIARKKCKIYSLRIVYAMHIFICISNKQILINNNNNKRI